MTRVESGKSTTADVLRVRLVIEEMKQELEILETSKTESRANLNQMMNQSLDLPVRVTDSLSFATLTYSKDSIFAALKPNHPMIRMFELQQEVSRKAISLNQLSGKPQFGVGMDYILVNPRTDAIPQHNGRDIVQLRASVSIPIYRKKFDAKKAEETLLIDALELKKTDLLGRFEAIIEKAYSDYDAARLRNELYGRQRELAQSAINVLESEYATKGNNFDELLRMEKELLDYDLKTLKAVVQSHVALSNIERFITL